MIYKIKSLIPYNLKKIATFYFPFNRSAQYSNLDDSIEQLNLSDFFLFRCDTFDTIFIAENSLALLTSNPIACKHKFYFYDQFGSSCGQYEVINDSFHYKLSINIEMTGNNSIGGFIHQTEYSREILDQTDDINLKKLNFHHRGYSGFKRNDNDSNPPSFVHGNFGGMYINKGILTSISRQRSTHHYSPQIVIKNNRIYEFVFLNPTNRKLRVSIFLINKFNTSQEICKSSINPFGSFIFELDTFAQNEISNISWITNLPIGRAIVFENNEDLFDVFHS